ncbi:hypothetical protein [Pseudomonas sp. LS-2]|uniref:hypothetical protein n=1 Tax=Pseudomonas sp. LS-2 TaxID=2315859 RepID=UPI0015AAE881|nr:hypothetical protein [Pseudomonas sp. LS-2]
MTDQNLLEMAARAAAIGPILCYESRRNCLRIGNRKTSRLWRPLSKGDDALRLAAILDINVEWFPKQQCVCADRRGIGEIIGWVDESGRAGALLRAITVAAAKIGAMEAA